MGTLAQAASDFRRSLRRPARATMAFWMKRTGIRLYTIMASGFLPDGTQIPKNTQLTQRTKQKKGLDSRPTIRTTELQQRMRLRQIMHFVSHVHGQINAAAGVKAEKMFPLLKGRKARSVRKTSRGHVYFRNVPAQKARDFVTHDPKVVEVAADALLDGICRQWGFA